MAPRYNHARELRTIGQQLDKQSIDIFDLLYEDGDYVLVCGDPNPPFTDLIHLRYSTFELKSLEFRAIEERSPGFKLVEFTGMGEILRAIGRHVERLEAKLVRISAPDAYRTAECSRSNTKPASGDIGAKIFANEVVNLAMRMYKERSHITGNSREGRSAT